MKVLSRSMMLALAFFILFLCGCSPLMSNFDQASYAQVTSLKVDALALMDKSAEDYASHLSDVTALQLELSKAIEYDKHRPNNTITNDMWNLLSDPNGHLLGGFLVKWKKDGKEGSAYVTDKKQQISDSFDQIADLEIKKIKAKQ